MRAATNDTLVKINSLEGKTTKTLNFGERGPSSASLVGQVSPRGSSGITWHAALIKSKVNMCVRLFEV